MPPSTSIRGPLRRWLSLGLVSVVGVAAWRGDVAGQVRPRPRVQDVVAAAGKYLARYQPDLTFVVADEVSTQVRMTTDGAATETRTTTGELFLTFLDDGRRWVAVHDVFAVDGVPVADREGLGDLLASSANPNAAARVTERNARYNLGRITRNFNEPTLVLLFFEPDRQARVRYAVDGDVPDHPDQVRVRFVERDRPTLVATGRGEAVYASGKADVDPGTGEIWRTEMRLRHDTIEVTLETVFLREPVLDLLVPSVFRERYARVSGRDREVITVESSYSRFRRFQSGGRLVPPVP